MKIAIMTWFQYHNYGTALQVVALSEFLKKNSFESHVVNYLSENKPVVKHKIGLLRDAWDQGIDRIKNHPYHRYEEKNREKKFDDFLNKHLTFTHRCYLQSELEELNEDFDAFICGSDQIWSPNVYNPHYFLDFVRDDNKLIAYAPSIGLPEIRDKNVRLRIAEHTNRFKHLSTREKSGSLLLESLIGKKVETVLDPTFLLRKEDWYNLAGEGEIEEEPYILVYMLGKNESHWKNIYKIAAKLHLTVKIIPVFFKDLKRKGCIKKSIGPKEFLKLVKGSSFVCTDSFHGTAFAINFHKNFCAFERFKVGDKLNQNSRIYNILDLLGLRSRLFKNKKKSKKYEEIDYTSVDKILDRYREFSQNYLLEALSSVEKYNTSCSIKNNILRNNSLCCGCGACQSVCPVDAIDISLNHEGFYQAEFDNEKCVSCGKCKSVCPYINRSKNVKIADATLFSYIDSDPDVLMHSSSGGMAHRLSTVALEQKYSVIGCRFNDVTHKAEHIIIRPDTESNLSPLQGSKYTQSQFYPVMDKIEDNMVVFGTPCQIAGVRALHGDKNNLILVDLICHGVPTYYLYKKYLSYLQTSKHMNVDEKLMTIFRYKPKGWRERYIYTENSENKYCESQKKDPYFLAFEHGFCYSKSCYECPWRDKSAADIRLGDYWHKKYSINNTGISMGAFFTDRGRRVISEIKALNTGKIKSEPINDYFECQQIKNNPRPAFWEELIKELSSERSMEDIIAEYIHPFEKRKKIWSIIRKVWKK